MGILLFLLIVLVIGWVLAIVLSKHEPLERQKTIDKPDKNGTYGMTVGDDRKKTSERDKHQKPSNVDQEVKQDVKERMKKILDLKEKGASKEQLMDALLKSDDFHILLGGLARSAEIIVPIIADQIADQRESPQQRSNNGRNSKNINAGCKSSLGKVPSASLFACVQLNKNSQ